MSVNSLQPVHVTVDIKKIVRLPELRGRIDLKDEHEVAVDYAALKKRAKELGKPDPFADYPITLVELPDGRIVLNDGWKRTEAAEICGETSINAVVWQGDWNFAIEMTAKSNPGHGVKRTNKDKRHVVEMVIDLWFERSDSWISDELAVSGALVADVRRVEIERRQKANIEVPTTRVSAKGKVQDTSKTGKSVTVKTEAVKRERRAKAALNKTPDNLKEATKALAERRAEVTNVGTPDQSMVESAREVVQEVAATGGFVTVPTIDGDKQVPADALMSYNDGTKIVELRAAEVAAIHVESMKAERAAEHRNGFQPDLKISVRGQDITQGKKKLGTTIGSGKALVVAKQPADSKLFDELNALIEQFPAGELELVFWREGRNGVKPITRPSKKPVATVVEAQQDALQSESSENTTNDAASVEDTSLTAKSETENPAPAKKSNKRSKTSRSKTASKTEEQPSPEVQPTEDAPLPESGSAEADPIPF